MSLSLGSFRSVSGGIFAREIIKIENRGLCQSKTSRLLARVQGWFKRCDAADPDLIKSARCAIKREFYQQLVADNKSTRTARKLIENSGLGQGFLTDNRPLTNRIVKRVLNEADKLRLQCAEHNDRKVAEVLRNYCDSLSPVQRSAFRHEIQSHPDYCRVAFSAAWLSARLTESIRVDDFWATSQSESRFRNTVEAIDHLNFPKLDFVDPRYRKYGGFEFWKVCTVVGITEVTDAIGAVQSAWELLGKPVWSRGELAFHTDMLKNSQHNLQFLCDQLYSLCHDQKDCRLASCRGLFRAAYQDAGRQLNLVSDRLRYIEQGHTFDVLDDTAVRQENRIWAKMGELVFNGLQHNAVNRGQELSQEQRNRFDTAKRSWTSMCLSVPAFKSSDSPAGAAQTKTSNNHPLCEMEHHMVKKLREAVSGIGLSFSAASLLLSPGSLARTKLYAMVELAITPN